MLRRLRIATLAVLCMLCTHDILQLHMPLPQQPQPFICRPQTHHPLHLFSDLFSDLFSTVPLLLDISALRLKDLQTTVRSNATLAPTSEIPRHRS